MEKADTPVAESKPLPRFALGLCALMLLTLAVPALMGLEPRALPGLARFAARFHLVLLHAPVVLLGLVLCLEICRQPLFNWFLPSAPPPVLSFVLGLGALGAWSAALCGWLLAVEGGYDPALLQRHFNGGLMTAAGAVVAWALRLVCSVRIDWRPRLAYAVVLLGTNGVMLLAAHEGGTLTHGAGFLTDHAPGWVRGMLGNTDTDAATSKASSPGSTGATFYDQAVHPILAARCVECHGPEKSKGKLRLDTLAHVMKGGSNGNVVLAGRTAESELIRRLRLPLEHDDRMPPQGKTQLTAEEEAVLAWWIESGASGSATVEQLRPPPGIQGYLNRAR